MPFDLSTAKPVGGFDLTTAKPVESEPEQIEKPQSVLAMIKSILSPESLKRGSGLAARTIAQGASDLALLPAELATAVNNAGNRFGSKLGLPGFKPYTVTLADGSTRIVDPATDGQLPSPSAQRDAMLDQAGLPQPQEGAESLINAASRGAIGAITGTGVASQVAKAAPALSTTQRVSKVIADAPKLAAVSGTTGGASADAARQAGAPPAVQMLAGLAGGMAPSARTLTAAAVRAIPGSATRSTAQAAKDEAVRILLDNDIPLTTAQRGNHKIIGSAGRAADTVIGPSEFTTKQQAAFNRAALKKIGAEADAATPEVMRDARTKVGFEFDQLAEQIPTQVDDSLKTALAEIADEAARELDASSLAPIEKQIRNLADKGASGVIDGRAAQNARTSLGRLSISANPSTKYVAGRIREALDEALERSAPTKQDAARVQAARDKYRAMKQIEDAVANSPEGNISPAKLFNVLAQKRNRNQTIYGAGEQGLVDLARAGKQLLREPVANSGTATRGMDVAKVAAVLTNPILALKTVGGVAAGRALNEYQPLARRIGGTGVRQPIDPKNLEQAIGALPPATVGAIGSTTPTDRRKQKLLARAMRARPMRTLDDF